MTAISFTVEKSVCTISINLPAKRNAVNGPVAAELRAAFERFEADDALHVAVLTGSGGHFCSGADLAAVADPALRNELDPQGGGSGPMGPTRMALKKPLIAAINGHAGPSWRGFGLVHLLVPFTLVMLALAFVALARRNLAGHKSLMQKLYIGSCVVAGGFTLLPGRLLGHWLWSSLGVL